MQSTNFIDCYRMLLIIDFIDCPRRDSRKSPQCAQRSFTVSENSIGKAQSFHFIFESVIFFTEQWLWKRGWPPGRNQRGKRSGQMYRKGGGDVIKVK